MGKKKSQNFKGLGSGIRNLKKTIKDDNEEVENKPTETDKKLKYQHKKKRQKKNS